MTAVTAFVHVTAGKNLRGPAVAALNGSIACRLPPAHPSQGQAGVRVEVVRTKPTETLPNFGSHFRAARVSHRAGLHIIAISLPTSPEGLTKPNNLLHPSNPHPGPPASRPPPMGAPLPAPAAAPHAHAGSAAAAKLTDVGAISALLHETLGRERAIEGELAGLLAQRPALQADVAHLMEVSTRGGGGSTAPAWVPLAAFLLLSSSLLPLSSRAKGRSQGVSVVGVFRRPLARRWGPGRQSGVDQM